VLSYYTLTLILSLSYYTPILFHRRHAFDYELFTIAQYLAADQMVELGVMVPTGFQFDYKPVQVD
jgi:hypothetical protein